MKLRLTNVSLSFIRDQSEQNLEETVKKPKCVLN